MRRHLVSLAQPRRASLLAAGALALAATPLLAQQVELPKGNSLAEVQERQAANEEQAKLAQQQLEQNATNEAEYEAKLKQVADAKAKIAADQAAAEAAYQAKLAANKAEAERITQEHEAAVAKWKADVEACGKGDKSRCAQAK
jgi:cell pole-organizing protein PopZ